MIDNRCDDNGDVGNASAADGDKVLCTDAVLKACEQTGSRFPAKTMYLKGFADPVIVHEVDLDS